MSNQIKNWITSEAREWMYEGENNREVRANSFVMN